MSNLNSSSNVVSFTGYDKKNKRGSFTAAGFLSSSKFFRALQEENKGRKTVQKLCEYDE